MDQITLCSDPIPCSFTRLHYHFEKNVQQRFISNLFLEKNLRIMNGTWRKFWIQSVYFASQSQVFFSLFYCVLDFETTKLLNTDPIWIRIYNTAWLTALLVVVVRTTIVVVICNSCSWEAANCLRSLPWWWTPGRTWLWSSRPCSLSRHSSCPDLKYP